MAVALMDDFPPAPDRLVTLSNWRKAPFSAWGFRNVRRLLPTANIAASGHAMPLEMSLEEIGHISFKGHDGNPTTVGQGLRATNTDAFVVLRRGRIAAEWYGNGMNATDWDGHIGRWEVAVRRERPALLPRCRYGVPVAGRTGGSMAAPYTDASKAALHGRSRSPSIAMGRSRPRFASDLMSPTSGDPDSRPVTMAPESRGGERGPGGASLAPDRSAAVGQRSGESPRLVV